MDKKQSHSTEEREQIVTLSNLKFAVRQIAKKIRVSETAAYSAITKYQNECVFKDKKFLSLFVYFN